MKFFLLATLYLSLMAPEYIYCHNTLDEVKSYYCNQQHEMAFESFLKLLDQYEADKKCTICDEEIKVYNEAYTLYMNLNAGDLVENCAKIINDYTPILENHPGYSQLSYLVALAYANLGDFKRHFDLFFRAYKVNPHHYLAYKTKGLLWVKLFERYMPGEMKEKARNELQSQFTKAMERYNRDTALYRLKILYSSDCHRHQIVTDCLNKIIRDDIVISRRELAFYLEEGFALDDKAIIRKFIDTASKWHPYSRTLEVAREKLKSI